MYLFPACPQGNMHGTSMPCSPAGCSWGVATCPYVRPTRLSGTLSILVLGVLGAREEASMSPGQKLFVAGSPWCVLHGIMPV